MGNQDIRAYLNGLYFEVNKDNIIVVATDGHRLSIGEIKQVRFLSINCDVFENLILTFIMDQMKLNILINNV
jgi:DNA polymerase III sliding clamp (beta) subunit (PCNA family)